LRNENNNERRKNMTKNKKKKEDGGSILGMFGDLVVGFLKEEAKREVKRVARKQVRKAFDAAYDSAKEKVYDAAAKRDQEKQIENSVKETKTKLLGQGVVSGLKVTSSSAQDFSEVENQVTAESFKKLVSSKKDQQVDLTVDGETSNEFYIVSATAEILGAKETKQEKVFKSSPDESLEDCLARCSLWKVFSASPSTKINWKL
jgi:hypothetical protein